MSLSVPLEIAPPRAGRKIEDLRSPGETWRAQARARIEARLVEECHVLSRELSGLSSIVEGAIGTEGRGGGRWRPMLTLIASEACGGAPEDALDAAMAIELTHTASLLLDDLPCMDDSDERRGQPSTHTLVGSAGAILLAVGMLARAAELLGDQPGCGGELARDWGRSFGMSGMAGGQAVDVAASGELRGAKRRLHRTKSTLLPALALGAGARIAGAPEDVRLALEGYGRAVGWAYQLIDDIQDAREDQALGRASSASKCPASHSARIMRWSTRRLRSLSGLEPESRELLIELAEQLIPVVPSSAPTSNDRADAWQGRR